MEKAKTFQTDFLKEFYETTVYADKTTIILSNRNKSPPPRTAIEHCKWLSSHRHKNHNCHLNDLTLKESKTRQIIFTTAKNNLDRLPQL